MCCGRFILLIRYSPLPHKHLDWSLQYNFVTDNISAGMMYKTDMSDTLPLGFSPLVLFFSYVSILITDNIPDSSIIFEIPRLLMCCRLCVVMHEWKGGDRGEKREVTRVKASFTTTSERHLLALHLYKDML